MIQNLSQFPKHYPWLLYIPILLLVTLLGARSLGSDALWLDEYWSMYHAGGIDPLSPVDVWTRIAQTDPWQTPGYYLLLNGWGRLVGWSEFGGRSLSLFAGLLALAWVYRLGRDLLSPSGGLTAGVVLGLSAYFVYFTHELRAYALYVLLTTVVLWAYWRLVTRPNAPLLVCGAFFAGMLGLLYTHYFAGLAAVALGIYHLLLAPKNRRWWLVTGLMAFAGVLFVPWMSVLIQGISAAGDQQGTRGTFAMTPYQSIEGVLYLFSNGSIALVFVVFFFAIRRGRNATFIWFWTLTLAALLLIVNAYLRVILEVRYLLALWPGLALLAALGMQSLGRTHKRLPGVILIIWSVAGVWNTLAPASQVSLHNPHWHLPWHTLERELEPRVNAGDSVVFVLPDWTWAVYHGDLIRYYLGDLPSRSFMLERPQNIGDEAYLQQADQATTNTRRLWMAYAPDQPHEHLSRFEGLLQDRSFTRCATTTDSESLHLALYGSTADDGRAGTVHFVSPEGTITYVPVMPLASTVSSSITVLDGWHLEPEVPRDAYSAALHLIDESGNLAAQSDYGLKPESPSCQSTQINVSSLQAGTYRLTLAVYDWQTGQRLRSDAPTALEDGRVVLGTIDVVH